MKGLRGIPRVLMINWMKGHSLSLLFNNGESKIIDIKNFLTGSASNYHQDLVDQILNDEKVFNSVQVTDTTISWPGVGIYSKDINGNSVFYSFDLDPLMLFESGVADDEYNLNVGKKIKTIRIEAGITQEELAKRSGTSKHYISRLENNKSDIEMMTLKKIVEAGLNKKLSININ